MKKIIIVLAIILSSCSADSMDIYVPPSTYYVKVTEITVVYKITYTDSTKKVVAQRLRFNTLPSKRATVYERTGVKQEDMEAVRDRFKGVEEQFITDQGTHTDYEWHITYNIEINKL